MEPPVDPGGTVPSRQAAGLEQPRRRVGLEDAPYLCIRLGRDGPKVRGVPVARLGHELRFPGRSGAEGIFAEWSWDGARLLVRNDRFGLHPLYYFTRADEIGVSPSLPRLLLEGAPTQLDDAALAVFLRCGWFIGQDTAFSAIRALPPAATLEWSGGRLRLSGGFAVAEPRAIGRDRAIDEYVARFREAVRRRLPPTDDFVVPLSGGRDSRHILLELCAAGRRPRLCLTVRHHPPRTDEDAELAARLTDALGLDHVILDQAERRLPVELAKNLKTSFCADEGTAFMVMGDYLDRRTRAVFDGIGGDVLSAGLYLSEERLALFRSGRFAELAEGFLWAKERVRALLDEGERHRFNRALAVERVAAELRRHAAAPNPVGSFIFWNRTRREIALFPHGFYGPTLVTLCPFLDHDVYDFLASLSATLLVDGQFHTETIRRAHPAYAHVPFESRSAMYRFDARYRAYLRRSIDDVRAYLDQAPSSIVSAPYVKERLAQHQRAGLEPLQFSEHLIYLLQLERFVAAVVTAPPGPTRSARTAPRGRARAGRACCAAPRSAT